MAPSGYAKKMPVEISPSSAGAESNYAVKLTLVKGSGTNAAGIGYLDNQCLNWPNDIRWTDNSGNELSFWREESDSIDGTWWVKVSSIPTGSNTTIWVYFGKSGDSDASSGAKTGALFDDFNGASLDTNKWDSNTLNSATIAQTGGNIEVTAAGSTGSGAGLTSKSALSSRSYAIEAMIKRVTGLCTGEYGASVGFTSKATRDSVHYGHYTENTVWFSVYQHNSPQWRMMVGATGGTHYRGSTETWPAWANEWVRVSAKYRHTEKGLSADLYYASTSKSLSESVATSQLSALYVFLHYGDYNKNGQKAYFDWIFVRPYIYPEPSVGTPGAMQDAVVVRGQAIFI